MGREPRCVPTGNEWATLRGAPLVAHATPQAAYGIQGDTTIKTEDLQYDLPQELIAQHPCEPRDAARLLVLHRATGRIEHRVFSDTPEYLTRQDCLVVNRTRVLPAKFVARRKSGGRLAGLFISEQSPGSWIVLLSGVGRLKEGERLAMDEPPWTMTFRRRLERGACEVRINPPDPASVVLEAVGDAPLPPYIRRSTDDPIELRQRDRRDYQTVFADMPGAVAAPTAGMHFTPRLLDEIRRSVGAAVADVILHVGLGTFQPVEVEDLADHPMHSEWYDLGPQATAPMLKAREAGGRIIAVGTTSVRVIETCAKTGTILPQSGWTDLLIAPPYTFRATDALLTNFHLPGSTLLALVYAFAGRGPVREAYEAAISRCYRFYSYGDAMLIL